MINLIEDHHEAYYLWKKEGLKGKTLVHIDAHIDFGFHDVKPPQQIFKEARTKQELKRELEKMILFKRLGFQEEKQTNIGNYIYPAMRDGIVNRFYWIIPGKISDFRASLKSLKGIIKSFMRIDPYKDGGFIIKDSYIKATIYNMPFYITILGGLPRIEEKALLDIDIDFLTTPNLKKSNSTDQISERRPWISPSDLVGILKERVRNPVYTTICYSVNGGFTPMKYKFLGDEIYLRLKDDFSPGLAERLFERQMAKSLYEWQSLKGRVESHNGLERQLKRRFLGDILFNCFEINPRKEFYEGALKYNPLYKVKDNNYGWLFLMKRKIEKAEGEFKKILSVDKDDIYARTGLGDIYLRRRKYMKANEEFRKAIAEKNDFSEAIFGMGMVKFNLKDYAMAKTLFLKYEDMAKPNFESRFYLARIYEMEKEYDKAQGAYRNAMQLGGGGISIILRMARILKKKKDPDAMKFVLERYGEMKRTVRHSTKAARKNKRFRVTKRFKQQLKRIGKILNEHSI